MVNQETTRTTANAASDAARPDRLSRMLPHAGILIAVASGVGYVVGYVSVWLFAMGLGAVPRDLGLGQREYLLIGAVWSVLLISYGLGSMAIAFGDLTYGQFMLVQSFLALIWVTLVVPWWPPIGLVLLATVIALGSVAALYSRRLDVSPRRFRRLPVLLNATGLLGAFLFAGYFSWWWGDHVRHEPASLKGRGGPIALSLIVPVTEGQVTLRSRDVCVVRVTDRVFVTKANVMIEAEPRSFRPRDCF